MMMAEVCCVLPKVSPCLRCNADYVQQFLSNRPNNLIWENSCLSLPSTQLVASGLACQHVIELLLGHGKVFETFEKKFIIATSSMAYKL